MGWSSQGIRAPAVAFYSAIGVVISVTGVGYF